MKNMNSPSHVDLYLESKFLGGQKETTDVIMMIETEKVEIEKVETEKVETEMIGIEIESAGIRCGVFR